VSDPPWLVWLLRVAWCTLPLTAGAAIADALADRSTAVGAVGGTAAWAGWLVGVLALVVARPSGLTALRLVAPAAVAATLWALLAGPDVDGVVGAGALAAAALAGALPFLPETGTWLVNGTAYGDERRFLLRAPGTLLAGPVLLAGLVVTPAVVAGPLLLAARQWVPGVLAVGLGWPVAFVCARALDALAHRWLVFVPAGVVLKDHITLAEPVLFKRVDVDRLGPAPADTDALDLTARSFGLALELVLREPYDLHRIIPGQQLAELGATSVLLFTPTRPGAIVQTASARRLRVT
jgi:hypothetical protein